MPTRPIRCKHFFPVKYHIDKGVFRGKKQVLDKEGFKGKKQVLDKEGLEERKRER